MEQKANYDGMEGAIATAGERYKKSVQLHYKRNTHHWQHWASPLWLNGAYKGILAQSVPTDDIIEMVVDWWAANKVQHLPFTVTEWYEKMKDRIYMLPESSEYLELRLAALIQHLDETA